ncbi:protein spinster 1-like protein [Leptotrombidium deliense]|uniref:Protein spinster 1-like protein n=1 Tax=Leptotrombidium deliense TaxID=299467 RepID=A0A443SBS3_9ACAR|nr:protein spinster 1-like protein [Leptotrombidium deliense]
MFSSDVIALVILCFINLINYMDRFTVAGILDEIQNYYNLDDKQGGLLQTSFVVAYMIFAPLFGYLGDRYSRKYLMCVGVLFWSLTTFLGSIIPKHYPGLFFLMRGLVGVGEASYSTIAPTLIADLFSKDKRSKCLAIFYFAIPVGSGLGYIIGTKMSAVMSNWKWALRVTPVLGVIAVVLTLLFLREPKRGQSDGVMEEHVKSDIFNDIKYISTVKSYIWSTIGFTCVCFAIGALSWWAPKFMTSAIAVHEKLELSENNDSLRQRVSLIFGIISCIAGIAGVVLGVSASQWYRKYNPRADPLVCGVGVLVSVPFAFVGILLASSVPVLTWIFVFIAVTLLCTNWSLVADILLYVIVPHRRSFAQSIQILISHLFGDASSPFIVGAISDAFKNDSTTFTNYISLRNALFVNCFVLIIGGMAFLYTAYFIVIDQENCKKEIEGNRDAIDQGSHRDSTLSDNNESLQSFPPPSSN